MVISPAHETSYCSVRILELSGYACCVPLNLVFRDGPEQALAKHFPETKTPGAGASGTPARSFKDRAGHCDKFGQALAFCCNHTTNRSGIRSSDVIRQALHGPDFLFETIRTRQVGFVDYENIGDFHNAGLDGLDIIAQTRHQDQDSHVGEARDFYLVLARADGFNQDHIAPGRVEEQREVKRHLRDTAQLAAARHGTNKNAGISVMVLHANAVAQDGAARERAAWVNGENADGLPLAPKNSGELIYEGALACAWRTRDTDKHGAARLRK
jgi:hypothetical protein